VSTGLIIRVLARFGFF